MASEVTLEIAFDLLHITDGDVRRNQTDITCPLCGDRKHKKLNVNFEKGVFHCNKCGVGGGALAFWGLMRGLSTTDNKEIAKDYYQFIGESPDRTAVVQRPRPKREPEKQNIASITTRDNTYRHLLSLLNLSEEHKKDLLRRGFSEDEIKSSDYRSYPQTGLEDICRKLISKGCVLAGVPGFYVTESGSWSLRKLGDGYLIPQKNSRGQIQGFQVRRSSGNIRYLTLSTDGYKQGAQGKAYMHFVKGNRGGNSFVITEGPLKADLINKFTGFSVLALQGVNAVSSFPAAITSLKNQGYEMAYVAFDMDLTTNETVQKALGRMEELLDEQSVPYKTMFWNTEYKGLDDWLLAKTKHVI